MDRPRRNPKFCLGAWHFLPHLSDEEGTMLPNRRHKIWCWGVNMCQTKEKDLRLQLARTAPILKAARAANAKQLMVLRRRQGKESVPRNQWVNHGKVTRELPVACKDLRSAEWASSQQELWCFAHDATGWALVTGKCQKTCWHFLRREEEHK